MEQTFTSNPETVSTLLGSWNSILETMLIVMAIDYITGVSSSFKRKTLSSAKGYAGLIKKANILLVIILAAQLDRLSGSTNFIFRNATAVFFIANDAISIIENIGEMGVRVPRFLRIAFIRLRSQNDQKPNEKKDSKADSVADSHDSGKKTNDRSN